MIDLWKGLKFKQKHERGERISLVDIFGRVFQIEGTATAKDLSQKRI